MIRHPKSRNKAWIYTWIGIGVLVIAIIIAYTGTFAAVPFMKFSTWVHDAGVASLGIFSKSSVATENENLRNKLAEIQATIDQNKLLVQENNELKELLGRHSRSLSIVANVLAKPPMSMYDTLVVDVGSSDKVTVGDTVLAFGMVPVGVVNTVYPHTSTVALYSSSGQKIDVNIAKNIQAVAESQGGGNFLVKLPKGTKVSEGDPVFASSIGAETFGHVGNIESNENDPFLYIRFSLPVNMSELHFLQIDRKSI